jgi:hypothetical protein
MAASGQTPLIHYYNNTTSTAPSLANLVAGELALNTVTGRLYYRTSAGAVGLLADGGTVTNVTTLSFGSTGLTPSTATSGAITVAGTLGAANGGTGITSLGTGIATALGLAVSGSGAIVLATSATLTSASLVTPALGTPVSGNFSTGTFTWPTFNQNTTGTAANVTGVVLAANGGTGLSSYTAGDILYASGTTALSKLAIGSNGYVLTSSGSAPQWTSTASFGVSTINFGTTGLTPNTATGGAITVAGTLVSGNGGTGFSTYATGDLVYASATNTLSKLTAGTNGYVLTLASGVPTWAASTGGVVSINFGSTGLTPSSATGGVVNVAGTLGAGYGGTGQSTYAVGDMLYASAATPTISKLTLGTAGQVMTVNSGATGPQWSAQSTLAVGTATNVAGGAAGSILYQSGAGVTTTLGIGTAYNILAVNAGATAPSYQTMTSLLDNNFSSGQGTILYRSATAWTALGAGTSGYYLQTGGTGANPLWAAVAAGLTGFTAALNTSSPNNTNNVSSITASGGTTNQFIALAPKGTGSIIGAIPDNTATGGNVRGTYSVDLQLSRTGGVSVVQSNYSAMLAGYDNLIASGYDYAGILAGRGHQLYSSYGAIIGGQGHTVTGNYAAIIAGQSNQIQGNYAVVLSGVYGSDRSAASVVTPSIWFRGVTGGNQNRKLILTTQTLDATATKLTTNNSTAGQTNQIWLNFNSAYAFSIRIIANVTGAGNTKAWKIEGACKIGASYATTALVGTPAVNVLAADSGASTWTATVAADTSNGAINVTVTGQASTTITWTATADLTEVGY